jgi:molybdopterin/thiamine biosynthesis adenylyltransferase
MNKNNNPNVWARGIDSGYCGKSKSKMKGTASIYATINGIIASLQSTSAIKYLTEAEGKIDQQLYYIDIWNNKFDKININN